jgi:chromosome partitioning protein
VSSQGLGQAPEWLAQQSNGFYAPETSTRKSHHHAGGPEGPGGAVEDEFEELASTELQEGPQKPMPEKLARVRASEQLDSEQGKQASDELERGQSDQASEVLDEVPSRTAVSEKDSVSGIKEDAPPGLEPGLQEIVRRLVPGGVPGGVQVTSDDGQPPAGAQGLLRDARSMGEQGMQGERTRVEKRDGPQPDTARRSTETSAKRPQEENISPARAVSKRRRGRMGLKPSSRQRRLNVSRETLSFGEVADNVGEDEVMEDEAAIAVRKAALRAAAEVAGASGPGQRGASTDPEGNASRETSRNQPDAYGGRPSGSPAADEDPPLSKETAATVDTERAARDARVTFQINRSGYNRFAIAVANQKGGVGKSTTAVNLGAYLALAGARVLVVDLDPQGNASTGLGLDHRQIEPSIYDVLMGDTDAASAIRHTPVRDLDVLPSTIDLAGAEVELVNAFSRETRLRQALGAARYSYDLVFIDCPPSLGLLTVNALAAADELLIPIQCEYYALEGLGQLLRNVDLVRVNLNQALHIGGIVLTMYDGRTRLAEQVVQEVRKHFTDLVYQTVAPRSVRLSEAPGYGVPIALYDPLSRGGIAYRDLALELADRTGLLAPTREGAN